MSWESTDLVQRGQREHQCLAEVAEHFRSAPEDLEALTPIAYIGAINAVLMRYVAGRSIWQEALRPDRFLGGDGVANAERRMRQAGRWLHWLHTIERDEASEGRRSRSAESLTALREHASALKDWGVDVDVWRDWSTALAKLENVSGEPSVWLHGDFHPSNLWALPDGHLLCLDTALERFGSPYEDLGNFTAVLKSRRVSVLSGGRFPSAKIVQRLEVAVLDGYHQGRPMDSLALQLYEGRFLLQKWLEMLAALARAVPSGSAPGVARWMIHPAFERLLHAWIEQTLQIDASHGRNADSDD